MIAVEHAAAHYLAHQPDVMGGVDLIKEAPHLFLGLARHLLALGDKLGDLLLTNAGMDVEDRKVLLIVLIDQPHHVCEELDQARLTAASLTLSQMGLNICQSVVLSQEQDSAERLESCERTLMMTGTPLRSLT